LGHVLAGLVGVALMLWAGLFFLFELAREALRMVGA
jgi:hypothetical protein